MKKYCVYEEYPHFDMQPNFDEINITQNCHHKRPTPCGCLPNFPPMPAPCTQKPNMFCDSAFLWLVGGIVIGKILK